MLFEINNVFVIYFKIDVACWYFLLIITRCEDYVLRNMVTTIITIRNSNKSQVTYFWRGYEKVSNIYCDGTLSKFYIETSYVLANNVQQMKIMSNYYISFECHVTGNSYFHENGNLEWLLWTFKVYMFCCQRFNAYVIDNTHEFWNTILYIEIVNLVYLQRFVRNSLSKLCFNWLPKKLR